MYHRIRIPEAEQQVHRFLWINLKTDCEPDVYAKTTLTFGDKPASAMAQIALRKTADEAKDVSPRAAQVLKKNTYMDDICSSVHSEEAARNLTRSIDTVLETGAFRVNGWLWNNAEKSNRVEGETKKATILEGANDDKVLGATWNCRTDKCPLNQNPG